MAKYPMSPRNWLRLLQVRIPGHHRMQMQGRTINERCLQFSNFTQQFNASLHHPNAHVRRHLIIATAAGVQFAAHAADQFGQPPFNRSVDVLVTRSKHETCFRKLSAHQIQPVHQLRTFLGGEHPRLRQCLRPCHAGADVRAPQPLVKLNTVVQAAHQGICILNKPPAPQLVTH